MKTSTIQLLLVLCIVACVLGDHNPRPSRRGKGEITQRPLRRPNPDLSQPDRPIRRPNRRPNEKPKRPRRPSNDDDDDSSGDVTIIGSTIVHISQPSERRPPPKKGSGARNQTRLNQARRNGTMLNQNGTLETPLYPLSQYNNQNLNAIPIPPIGEVPPAPGPYVGTPIIPAESPVIANIPPETPVYPLPPLDNPVDPYVPPPPVLSYPTAPPPPPPVYHPTVTGRPLPIPQVYPIPASVYPSASFPSENPAQNKSQSNLIPSYLDPNNKPSPPIPNVYSSSSSSNDDNIQPSDQVVPINYNQGNNDMKETISSPVYQTPGGAQILNPAIVYAQIDTKGGAGRDNLGYYNGYRRYGYGHTEYGYGLPYSSLSIYDPLW